MKVTNTNKRGYRFTTYTAKAPFKVLENGLGIYKILITWDNSRVGRVVYDRQTIVK